MGRAGARFPEVSPPKLAEYDQLVIRNRIFKARTQGVGSCTLDEAVEWGVTGPGLRACGFDWDFRKRRPYSGYEQFEFDIPTAQHGDCYDRAVVRVAEMRQSLRIIEQCVDNMPAGPYKSDHPLTTPPLKERTMHDIETLITHFLSVSWGPVIPPGEAFVGIEATKGNNGYFLCDRGRFGYAFVNGDRRLRHPLSAHAAEQDGRQRSGPAEPTTKEEVLRHLGELLSGGARVIGIGSPRASLEANFALRTLVGPERFYLGMSERDCRLTAAVRDIFQALGRDEGQLWHNLDDVGAALAEVLPVFQPITEIAPPADFRVAGQKIPRQPARYSGRTAMWARRSVHEPQPPEDVDSPLAFSMEGYPGQPPAALIPRFWAPGWNSVQALNKFQSEVGGPLRGGDPGRRLIEPAPGAKPLYFDTVPPAFQPRADEWLIIPLYHIFGSEELSILAPGIAERAPQPYLGLNPDDVTRLQVREGDELELCLGGTACRLPVKPMPTLPVGLAGYPAGLPRLPGIALPAWGALRPSKADSVGAKR
jgi:hypothetical protein